MSIRLLLVFGAVASGACITGRVVDATGLPVGGGSVELITRTSIEALQQLDWDGLFRFCNAPASEYKLVIRVQGFRVRRTAAFSFDPAKSVQMGDVAIAIGEITEGPWFGPVPKTKYPVVWSANGVVVLETRKGRKRRLTEGVAAVLSPDNRRVVFVRARENGEAGELWVVDTDGKSAPEQISQPVRPIWNLHFEGNELVVYETTTWETGDTAVTLPLRPDRVKK